MVAPGMYDYKPPQKPKETRWERFKKWAYCNDLWSNLGATLICLIILGGIFIGLWLRIKPDPADAVTSGIVVDMGSVRPGKTSGKYSYWVVIESNEAKGTWYVSDTYYERINIGDYVEKGKLPEEDDGK